MRIFFIVLFFGGLLVVLTKKNHLISVFIGIEFIILGILYCCSRLIFYNIRIIFLVMCLGVCEARVCLALLVIIVRLSGNDLISRLSLY